jgi:hypothetical protein
MLSMLLDSAAPSNKPHLTITHQQSRPAAWRCSRSIKPCREPHPHTPLIPPALPAAAAATPTAAAAAAAFTQLEDLQRAISMRYRVARINLSYSKSWWGNAQMSADGS